MSLASSTYFEHIVQCPLDTRQTYVHSFKNMIGIHSHSPGLDLALGILISISNHTNVDVHNMGLFE